MPCKLDAFCYVRDFTEKITQDYIVKKITAIVKMNKDNPTKVTYLQVKAFVPLGELTESKIEPFEVRDTIYLKGKFVDCSNWYLVCFSIYLSLLFFTFQTNNNIFHSFKGECHLDKKLVYGI